MSENNALPPSVEDIDRAPLQPAPRQMPSDEDYDRIWQRMNEVGIRNFELLEENAKLRREKQTTDILNELAAPYAKNAFLFMCGYSSVVGIILLLDGFGVFGFDLEQGLMEILIGSTAVTVIGLVATVLTGIFLSRPK